MEDKKKKDLVDYLSRFVSDRRKGRISEVLAWRTRYLTLVLEDIYQPHNASAVLRSCECFGIQDVHVIEERNTYQVNPDVAMGASKWLNIERYKRSEGQGVQYCLEELRRRDYWIVAASPHRDDVSLDELEITRPLAIVLGTEERGLSQTVMQQADQCLSIPIWGFTESFNVSVCAALILRDLTNKLHRAPVDWGLTATEKLDLRLAWFRQSIRGCSQLEARYWNQREKNDER